MNESPFNSSHTDQQSPSPPSVNIMHACIQHSKRTKETFRTHSFQEPPASMPCRCTHHQFTISTPRPSYQDLPRATGINAQPCKATVFNSPLPLARTACPVPRAPLYRTRVRSRGPFWSCTLSSAHSQTPSLATSCQLTRRPWTQHLDPVHPTGGFRPPCHLTRDRHPLLPVEFHLCRQCYVFLRSSFPCGWCARACAAR